MYNYYNNILTMLKFNIINIYQQNLCILNKAWNVFNSANYPYPMNFLVIYY